MNKKLVFCGGGNMAEGILKSILKSQIVSSENITVNELLPARCQYLNDTYKVCAKDNVDEEIKSADLVIIAVNPHQVSSVTAKLKDLVSENTVVMSIAAGVTLETLSSQLGENTRIARVIPNTLYDAGNGYSALCLNELCSDEDSDFAEELLSALGDVMRIRENMFDSFVCYSNVGPLWVYKMIEAMTDAGVYVGFSRNDARNIAIKNVAGAAQVLDITGEHPTLKIEKMASPGGVTIESLKSLQEEGFSNTIMNSVVAGFNKVKSIK